MREKSLVDIHYVPGNLILVSESGDVLGPNQGWGEGIITRQPACRTIPELDRPCKHSYGSELYWSLFVDILRIQDADCGYV